MARRAARRRGAPAPEEVDMRTSIALSALTAVVLAGCAAVPPEDRYQKGVSSYVTGAVYYRANANVYPVRIDAIDGETNVGQWALVQPGMRTFRLIGPPPPGLNNGPVQEAKLEIKPCTRYWIAAYKADSMKNEFQPVIDYQEPLAGCAPVAK
jgi:hypothetical protein